MAVFAVIAAVATVLPAASFSYVWALRPQAFFFGALIFCITLTHPALLTEQVMGRTWLKRIGLLLGLLATFCAPNHLKEPYVIPTVAVGAAIALASTLGAGRTFSEPLSSMLNWIGERSYSIYLCHTSLIFCLRKVSMCLFDYSNPSPLWMFFVCAIAFVAMTFWVADVSYRLIARPMIRCFPQAAAPALMLR